MVTALAFSPDGRKLASASYDGTCLLWDLTGGGGPELFGPPLVDNKAAVNSVAFSPDGQMLATGRADATVRFWDVSGESAPKPLGPPLLSHKDSVSCVAFSLSGGKLASGSADGTIFLRDANYQAWATRACRIVNRNLSKAEWDQYIGASRPYQPTCPELPHREGVVPDHPAAGP
jgi:WD40 repeat protein